MWKGKALLRHAAHQSGTENPRHSRASAGDFRMGRFARCNAPEASWSGKPDQLTPVLSAGTVKGRAGCVKSRSVQTFPHFAGLPVENRGRPGDRKKPAVPVEQPVLNRQTQALWLAASMASIIAARTPASSMARMPRMVVPPGEQTLSLSAPGCRPLSSSILPAPITVWAASS